MLLLWVFVFPKYFGWDHVTLALKTVADKLKDRENIKEYRTIYALGRGGMVPTRLLSGKMKIKDVGFIDPNLLLPTVKGNRAIVCDDIFDTGLTYRNLVKKVPLDTIFVFLFIRSNMIRGLPDNVVYGTVLHDMRYIVFPWEASETD
jgi:hypoxanthine phosphoribosyltransferase